MPGEFFSCGAHAKVYRASKIDQMLMPGAEVVRTAKATESNEAAETFLRTTIAHLMYPENILAYLGGGVLRRHRANLQRGVNLGEDEYWLYSKLAPVPNEHAVYARHQAPYKIYSPEPECRCAICLPHQNEIHNYENQNRATQVVEVAYDTAGIILPDPWQDPTDFCITSDGTPIFFEVEQLNRHKLMRYVQSLSDPTAGQVQAGRLAEQYHYLVNNLGDRFSVDKLFRMIPTRRTTTRSASRAWYINP